MFVGVLPSVEDGDDKTPLGSRSAGTSERIDVEGERPSNIGVMPALLTWRRSEALEGSGGW